MVLPTAPPPDIEGYEILGALGEGGMGAVFLARDEILHRKVAIKVVSRRISGDPQSRERFLREARTLATIEHPNVVRVYSFGELDQNAYLVLEYVEGETLSDRISREGPLSPDDALGILRQVVLALEAAHESGIVHRDIKPSNILLGRRGVVRVADFGLAKPTSVGGTSEAITQSGHMLGTPHYVSPEQALGKQVDFRSDIYSLGIVLYEMLSGERPFDGTTPMAVIAKGLNEPLPDIRRKRDDVPVRIVDLLEWMTAKDVSRRPESYARLLEAIEGQSSVTLPTKRSVSSASPLRVVAAAAAIGLLMGIVGSFLAPVSPPVEVIEELTDRMKVAVCPFWGPDDDSAREGRVMAALIERSIEDRLGADVTVLGIDRTGDPVRSHDDARTVGRRLDAGVVVWGEAIALRGDTEILPSFTLSGEKEPVKRKAPAPGGRRPDGRDLSGKDLSAFSRVDVEDVSNERAAKPLRLSTEARDQIEMRHISADEVGDVVTFLAGLQSLQANDAERALGFFERSTVTADVLRHQAEALIRLERTDEAIALLRRALELEPDHAASHARLADLLWLGGEGATAVAHYRAAEAGGSHPVTLLAALHEERLFARELWERAPGKKADSGYLLIMDPDTRKVLERHYIPGQIIAFDDGEEGLEISWTDDTLDTPQTLVWRRGGFDRPIYPGGNLLPRMNALRSGLFNGFNFIQGAWGAMERQEAHPRYALPADTGVIDESRPTTYDALEAFLIPAIERDPTQPWHLFHLGWVQMMTGREASAVETWMRLTSREWPGVPYSEFAWMAKLFERFGEREWADRAFDMALAARRKNAQEVKWSLLLERLIVAPVARLHEVHMDDPERAYQWLQRVRELSGATEGERVVSGIWAEWFARQKDDLRSRAETDYQGNVFDLQSRWARFDYLLYLILAFLTTFVALVVVLLGNGIRRARLSLAGARPVSRVMSGMVPAIAAAVFAYSALLDPRLETRRSLLVGCSMFFGILLAQVLVTRHRSGTWTLSSNAILRSLWLGLLAFLIADSSATFFDPALVLFPIATVLFVLDVVFSRTRTDWVGVVGSINREERFAALAIALVLASLSALLIVGVAKQSRISSMPVGVADSLGHPVWTEFLDRALDEKPNDALRYAAAAAHHLEGDFERAKELYGMLPNDERAKAGLAAIDQGKIEVLAPSGPELVEGLTEVPLSQLFESIGDDVRGVVLVPVDLSVLALVCSLLHFSVRSTPAPDRQAGRVWKTLGAIVPAIWWLRTGHTRRGAVTLMLLTLLGIVALVLPRAARAEADDYSGPGIISAMMQPSYDNAPFPLPGDLTRNDIPRLYRKAIFFSQPGTRGFLVVLVVSLGALVLLHGLTVRDILRAWPAGSIHEAETAITPSKPEDIATTPVADSDATAIKPR